MSTNKWIIDFVPDKKHIYEYITLYLLRLILRAYDERSQYSKVKKAFTNMVQKRIGKDPKLPTRTGLQTTDRHLLVRQSFIELTTQYEY